MWITRSSRSSSMGEGFVSPDLSRASTVSDLSEGEISPTTVEDGFGPVVARVHSTKASISSVGEALWRPVETEAEGKKKEFALWEGGEVVVNRGFVVGERAERVPVEGELEMPVFGADHSLWRPSTEVNPKVPLPLYTYHLVQRLTPP